VLAAYGGGLGDQLGLIELVALATLTWLATVLLADAMSRHGYRGPAETLLRQLTYRTTETTPQRIPVPAPQG
jgi:uncharacterized protein